jgi:hypothetical protein
MSPIIFQSNKTHIIMNIKKKNTKQNKQIPFFFNTIYIFHSIFNSIKIDHLISYSMLNYLFNV